MRRGRRYAVGLAVAAAMLTTAAPIQAQDKQWFPPQAIGGDNMFDSRPAMDQYGGAFVLFTSFSEMAGAQRPAGGDFAPPVFMPWLHAGRAGLHNALPMYDAAGRLLITWGDTENGDLRYAIRDPATGAGRIGTLVESERRPDAFGPAMAADGDGTIYFAWRENREQNGQCCYGYNGPFVATMEDGQAFRPAQQIAAQSGVDQGIALDASTAGAAAIVWPDVSGPGSGFMTSVQPVGGNFGPPERIPGVTAGITSGSPKVSIDDAGAALFAIKSVEPRAMQEPATHAVVTVRHPDGTFTEPRTISTTDQASDPTIAAGPSGEAVIAWAEGEYENANLLVSVRRPDGSFAEPVTLAAGGLRRIEPQIGMDAVGNAIVTWGAGNSDGWGIYAAHRPPSGAFGPSQAISGPNAGESYPRLAVGGPGNAVVSWDGNPDGQGPRVEAAVFDVAPPLVPEFDVVAPARPAVATAARSRRRARRIRFHWYVTEESQVAIKLRRHGRTVRTVKANAAPGVNKLKVRRRKLRRGRYRAVLRATDRLGHESKPQRARFKLRAR
jgi:hypothetical protein